MLYILVTAVSLVGMVACIAIAIDLSYDEQPGDREEWYLTKTSGLRASSSPKR